tara:strand:+ start:236 stop:448 length:213 start_codon:yes stop_codon:yes gene_type:complete
MESNDNLHLLIDGSTNLVVDYTLWDGNTETWSPPSGFYCIGVTTCVAVGSTYNSGGVGIGSTSGNKWIVS